MNQLKQLIERVRPVLAAYRSRFLQSKFYTNKRIFLPVTIASGLIILVILIGLIFGGRRSSQPSKNLPSPTPASSGATPVPTGAANTLSQIEQKLTDDKNQINAIDVKESRLLPPTLNFNIKF
jgi:hypothetical protein